MLCGCQQALLKACWPDEVSGVEDLLPLVGRIISNSFGTHPDRAAEADACCRSCVADADGAARSRLYMQPATCMPSTAAQLAPKHAAGVYLFQEDENRAAGSHECFKCNLGMPDTAAQRAPEPPGNGQAKHTAGHQLCMADADIAARSHASLKPSLSTPDPAAQFVPEPAGNSQAKDAAGCRLCQEDAARRHERLGSHLSMPDAAVQLDTMPACTSHSEFSSGQLPPPIHAALTLLPDAAWPAAATQQQPQMCQHNDSPNTASVTYAPRGSRGGPEVTSPAPGFQKLRASHAPGQLRLYHGQTAAYLAEPLLVKNDNKQQQGIVSLRTEGQQASEFDRAQDHACAHACDSITLNPQRQSEETVQGHAPTSRQMYVSPSDQQPEACSLQKSESEQLFNNATGPCLADELQTGGAQPRSANANAAAEQASITEPAGAITSAEQPRMGSGRFPRHSRSETSVGRALFLQASFFNHSCQPSCYVHRSPAGASVVSLVPIQVSLP